MIDTLKKHADNLKTILELEGEEGQFEYLIDIGKKEGSLEPEEKIDKNKMSGCLAQVWIKFDTKNGKNYFLDFTKQNKLPIHQFIFSHYKKQTGNNPSSMAIFEKKLRSIANTIKDNYIKKYVL